MDDAPKISGKEMADILASIDAKINYIYYGFSDEYICTYDIEKMIYSTYNGKRYLDCEIDVYMIPLVDNNKADNSPYFVKLYVCLD